MAALAAVLVAACGVGSSGEPEREAAEGAPNIVAIVLDDATAEMITRESMPVTTRELARRGTSFEDFIAVSPLCCPSRANLLTGQYGRNSGVLRNDYRTLRKKGRILARWLQLAGYRTLHVGKYLNGFTKALDDPAEVPKGWDEWYTLVKNGYFDYEVSDNGELVSFGARPDDYVTRVLNRRARELVSSYAERDEPFYLQLDQFAPHPRRTDSGEDCNVGATPDPDDREDVRDLPVPEKRSRNEADLSDKPGFMRRLERLSDGKLRRALLRYQCAVASLAAVDRGVGELIEALEEAGELEQTAFLFTSDNGFMFAEHRIPDLKGFPYEENLRMPLFVRLPAAMGVDQPRRVDALTGTIDLAPTILELASAEPCKENGECREPDGRSLLPLLGVGGRGDWPRDRALLIELDQIPPGVQKKPRACSWIGVRTRDRVLIQHRTAATPGAPCRATDAVEHYDLEADPEQLENLASAGGAEQQERRLRRRMRELSDCADESCE